MKKRIIMLLCAAMLLGYAQAETEVQMPGSRYFIKIPDGMEYSAPREGDQGIHAWFSDSLEMNYTSYPAALLFRDGEEQTLLTLAESRISAGDEVEIRLVNGVETLVFRMTDETDGAPGIGYLIKDGDRMVEIDFWYATQEAADLTAVIISGIHEGKNE